MNTALAATAVDGVDRGSVYVKCVKCGGEWESGAAGQTAGPRTLIRSTDS